MTDTTATTVITPMMTPRSVRNDRSLWALMARQATRRSSPFSIEGLRALLVPRDGAVVDLHPVADPEGAERAERPGDDLVPFLQPLDDLDLELGRDPGLHLPEVDLAVLVDDEDPLDVLLLVLVGGGRGRGRAPASSPSRGA